MTSETFSADIRQWRLSHGLSQKMAAEVFHVSVSTYRNWEYRHDVPSLIWLVEQAVKRYEQSLVKPVLTQLNPEILKQ